MTKTWVTIYLNRKQSRIITKHAKELNITEYKLLRLLAIIFTENPHLFLPLLREKLKYT